MKRIISILALVAIVLVTFGTPVASAQQGSGRYVIVFNGNRIPGNAANAIAAAGGQLVRTFPEIGVGIAVSGDPNFAANARGVRGVQQAGPSGAFTLPSVMVSEDLQANAPDPAVDIGYYTYQWDIRRVGADRAWDVTTGSHDVVVSIIDTGIAWNHPDLAPNVVYTACFAAFTTCTPYPTLSYHGTHVAGTVAAAFGGGGAVGVGPNLGLASYNVFEVINGSVLATDEAIWAAMLDTAARGYEVINMSLGGYIFFSDGHADGAAVWTAWNRVANYVRNAGVTIVASSGNGGVSLNGAIAHIPGDLPGIINVGGTGIRPEPTYPQVGTYDVLAYYSNYGASVTLVAPGGDTGPDGTPWPFPGAYYLVYSTYVDVGTGALGYAWAGGTSMASPHVAAAAGLVKTVNPRLNPNQVESILKRTAQDLGNRQFFGHGMLDVFAAVTAR
ncbi:MAG: S8 family serine peptidase [Anaerolineae bacterium]|nr:S8 family serine peptidase [Anaerolineae bacterium]